MISAFSLLALLVTHAPRNWLEAPPLRVGVVAPIAIGLPDQRADVGLVVDPECL